MVGQAPSFTPSAASACPCGSSRTLDECCLPILVGRREAATASELLRARYVAMTRGDVDFIVDSNHSRTRPEIDRSVIEKWAKSSEWLELAIHGTEKGASADQAGAVLFCATYRTDGKIVKHWEKSFFERENGAWRFLDAKGADEPIRRDGPKVGRNDPCPCGSGQKHKKCCGV